MRIIVGLILLTAIYGAYHMIAGIIADDLEDDGQTFFGAKIFTGAILLLAVIGVLALMFGGGAS